MTMLSYILQVSACWGIFYLLYALVLSRTTFFSWNRAYLMLTLVVSLALPTLEWPVPEAPSPAALQAAYYMQPITIGVQQLKIVVTGTPEMTSPEHSAPALSWPAVLLFLYWAGVMVAGLRLLYGIWQILVLYRRSEVEKRNNYSLVNTPTLHTPFSFFRLLFWSRALPYPKADAAKIIRHEQAHMDGWHSIDILIAEALAVLFWFNPLIYLYTRSLRTVHEYLADEAVLHHSKKTTYGHLLIRQSQSGQAIALANHFSHVQLKKRILMMTKKKSHRHQLLRYALTLPLLAALAFAFTLPDNPAGPAQAAVLERNGPQPVFKGCETLEPEDARQQCTSEKLMAFIQQKLKYPAAAKAAGQEGMTVVEFTVSKTGAVEQIKVLKSAGEALDQAAVAVVRQLPDWVPAADESGQPVAAKMTLPFQFKLPADEGEEVFKVVEEMPRFPGCEDIENPQYREKCAQQKLLEFVYENIKYPKEAKEAGAEGVVVVKLIIAPTGEVREYRIIRSVAHALDKEVLRIAQLMQKQVTWVPGKQRGKKVAVEFNLPVAFRLPELDKVQEEKAPKDALRVIGFTEQDKPERLSSPESPAALIVLNGIAYPGVRDFEERFDIKPDNIDHINVLKGEAAIEKYGQDAANGVIEIYTKSGQPETVEVPVGQSLQLHNFRTSPNPTSGELRVRFKGEATPTTLRILSLNGQELLRQSLPRFDGQADETLDLSHLPKGTVLLEIRQGEQVKVEKVVLK